jgi:membrane associated rhomboid family serine protease
MASLINDIKYAYRTGDVGTRLLFVNIGVFLILTILRIIGSFSGVDVLGAVTPWITANSGWEEMLFKPWTLITYMFVHLGFWHILTNMILLYFSGRIFEGILNGKRLLAVYFLGGITGFLLYFIAYNIFPVFNGSAVPILGASASIMAILVAIATYSPNMVLRLVLIGNVKLKYIAIFFVAMDLLFLDQGSNTGGKLAHLGGALFGYLYSVNLQKGNDWSGIFYSFTGFFSDLFNTKPKMKVASKRPMSSRTAPPKKESSADQEKIDAILDKISRSGYDSLSKSEKEFLFNASKKP